MGEDNLLDGAGQDIVRGGAGWHHVAAAPDRAADFRGRLGLRHA